MKSVDNKFAVKLVNDLRAYNDKATVLAVIDDASYAEISEWSGCDITEASQVASDAYNLAVKI